MVPRENSSSSADTAEARGAVTDFVGASRDWALKLVKRETWYSMSQVLGLKRLQELIQGTCSLSDDPVWLLGLWYGLQDADAQRSSMTPELHQLLLDDLHTRFWFTYRRDFPPIGSSGLTSDVGWGCTLRSGQMLMAEALARCWWGRSARCAAGAAGSPGQAAAAAAADAQGPAAWHSHELGCQLQQQQAQQQAAAGAAGDAAAGSPRRLGAEQQAQLLQLFVDQPGGQAPFSIHHLCSAGAPHGVVAGQWLGPWVLCKALAAAAAAAVQQAPQQQQQQQQRRLGLQVHVVCDPGGGAPALQPSMLRQVLQEAAGGSSSSAATQASPQQPQQQQQQQGLLLLVPLTLGVGKVNERYLPQLSRVLSFPQSVGIVGGRPGASLFFVGVQGGAVLYLDPHEVQDAPSLPGDVASFHCSTPRLMQLAAIDPSLAIGFFCADTGDLDDLFGRLQQLADAAGGAPLMTVTEATSPTGAGGQQHAGAAAGPSGEAGKADDWEFV